MSEEGARRIDDAWPQEDWQLTTSFDQTLTTLIDGHGATIPVIFPTIVAIPDLLHSLMAVGKRARAPGEPRTWEVIVIHPRWPAQNWWGALMSLVKGQKELGAMKDIAVLPSSKGARAAWVMVASKLGVG